MPPTKTFFSHLLMAAAAAVVVSASPSDPTPGGSAPPETSGDAPSTADCSGYALNRGTWAELGIDNYLLHYPGGQNLSLFDYTRSLNVLNFDCGVGKICLAGQLCHPVRGRDWVVLSAVQEWNFYINSMYDAIGTAMGMVQGTSAAMVADFLPDGDEKKRLVFLTAGLVSLSGVIILGFTMALVVPILWTVLVVLWDVVATSTAAIGTGIATAWAFLTTSGAGTAAVAAEETAEIAASTAATTAAKEASEHAVVGALGQEEKLLAGSAALQKRSPKHHHPHHEPLTHDKFQLWSALNTNLEEFRDRLQSMVAVTAKLTLYSPISSKDGIYGALQNGTFLSDHPPKATLVDNARDTVQLGVLAQLFRVMNVIFVIDANPCKQEGPTTPLKDPEAVHFCSASGVKTSLGMIQGKTIDYKIRNGREIFSKYSYTTEFLYELAAECDRQRASVSMPASHNGTLVLASHGAGFLPGADGTNVSADALASQTRPAGPLNTNSNSSAILLPDGSSICAFPLPICDLRKPEIKARISPDVSPAEACAQALKLADAPPSS